MAALNRFAERVGEAPDTAVMRAQLYEAMGQREKAGESFLTALLMNPNEVHLPWNYAESVSDAQWSA